MLLKIKPIFSKKIWGGNRLSELFNFDIPSNKTGEAWLISGYPGFESTIDESGIGLNQFYKENKLLFNNYQTEDFPLLVKFIDANNDLSVQVHPDDKLALKLENQKNGKSECWYVIDTKNDDVNIIVDTKAKDINELKELIDEKKWNELINSIKIKKGDVLNIEPGLVHAIKSGTFIYELQQSSDITYRLYDYDRLEDGKPRELHIKKSIKSIKFNNNYKQESKIFFESKELVIKILIHNDYFNLSKWDLNGQENIRIPNEWNFLLITIIEGKLSINNEEFEKGNSLIITSDSLNEINLNGEAKLLVGNPN